MDNRIYDLCRELRDLGCVIACFLPEELRGADPDQVEDRLVEVGWTIIDGLATEVDYDK